MNIETQCQEIHVDITSRDKPHIELGEANFSTELRKLTIWAEASGGKTIAITMDNDTLLTFYKAINKGITDCSQKIIEIMEFKKQESEND